MSLHIGSSFNSDSENKKQGKNIIKIMRVYVIIVVANHAENKIETKQHLITADDKAIFKFY